MSVNVHITHINDSEANIAASLDNHQSAIQTTTNSETFYPWCYKHGTSIYECAVLDQKATFLETSITDLNIAEYITHAGDADNYLQFTTDKIALNTTTLLASSLTGTGDRWVVASATGVLSAPAKPTTLAGYGITDAAPLTHGCAQWRVPVADTTTSWASSPIYTDAANTMVGIGATPTGALFSVNEAFKINSTGHIILHGDYRVSGQSDRLRLVRTDATSGDRIIEFHDADYAVNSTHVGWVGTANSGTNWAAPVNCFVIASSRVGGAVTTNDIYFWAQDSLNSINWSQIIRATTRAVEFGGKVSITGNLECGSAAVIGTGTRTLTVDCATAHIQDYMAEFRCSQGIDGDWTGILWSYRAAPTVYSKGGFVYKTRDGNNRGEFHFLLQADASTANATITDSKMSISYTGICNIATGLTIAGATTTQYSILAGDGTKGIYQTRAALGLFSNTNLAAGYVSYCDNATNLTFSKSPIYTDGTKVGIGTATLTYLLDVNGNGTQIGATTFYAMSVFLQDKTNYRGLLLGYNTTGEAGVIAATTSGGAGVGNIEFWTYTNGGPYTAKARIAQDGTLGINGGLHVGTLVGTAADNNLIVDGTGTITGAFGCNTKTAQTAYASGGALSAYSAGAKGYDTDAHAQEIHTLLVNIRAALVANGIMS